MDLAQFLSKMFGSIKSIDSEAEARRRAIAMAYYSGTLAMIDEWVLKDTEYSNFYYGLTDINRIHLIHFVSVVTGCRCEDVDGYIRELENDLELREHLARSIVGSTYGKDIKVDYGRRYGWYAFVRAMKPRVVVETGVDHGVGACVLASALKRNCRDGRPGRYIGTELRPEAGALFSNPYSNYGEIRYGDSIETLSHMSEMIDLFVNDSDHSAEYEYREYLTIKAKLAPGAVILGDNSHVTDSLSRFSRDETRNFLFFSEKPANHWYPGAGIGASFLINSSALDNVS